MIADLTPTELASYVVAGGTLILSALTWRSNVASRNAVRAALAQSSATERVIREIRTDHELERRPVLLASEIRRRKRLDTDYEISATISNIGNGPAINGRYVTQS